ncbi:MAG: hypothetical protein JWO82_263 [Akkermansiaceae bacterium]|nr:hypothetical protein [Akkermansiaceae bacterium]
MRLPPWTWKILRSRKTRAAALATAFVCLAGIVLFYIGANWESERVARQRLDRWRALKIQTNPNAYFLAAAAEPDLDLFSHPAMQATLREKIFQKSKALVRLGSETSMAEGKPANLTTWVDAPETTDEAAGRRWLDSDRAAEVFWLELRPAFGRPDAAWPVRDLESVGAAYQPMAGLSRYGCRHAVAEMVTGNMPEALSDTEALIGMQRLTSLSRPCLFSGVVASLMGYGVRNTIWEGIARDLWDDAALAAFERDLSALDPQRAAVLSLAGEMAFAESVLKGSGEASPAIDWTEIWTEESNEWMPRLRGLWSAFRPRGLARLEEIHYYDDLVNEGLLKDGQPRTSFTLDDFSKFQRLAGMPAAVIEYVPKGGTPHSITPEPPWRSISLAARMALTGQAGLGLLRSGIAVERYRLKHGHVPETLDRLVPEFLPAVPEDPFSGKPLRYRVKSDGSPWIWSYGINAVDDEGVPGTSEATGDLIWITRPPLHQ